MNTIKKVIENKYFRVGLALLLGGLIGWIIKPSNEKGIAPEHQHMASDDQTWTCSMHPQIKQNEPGDCPICGMELIPLKHDQESIDPAAIRMSPTAMQLANVKTARVGMAEPVKLVNLNGKVQEDERLVFSQVSHIPGRIEKLNINFTGEFVKKGQTVAYVYSPDLVTAQEELFEARRIKESQPALFKAAKQKLKNWKLTNRQIDRILQSGETIDAFPVLADVSGYVTEKMINLGDYVQRGNPIYKIAGLSSVWVLFDVYESDMPWVKQGDTVNFTVASLPGKAFRGVISYIDPVIDPQTRVARARVEVNNDDLALKPEMFASGTVESGFSQRDNVLAIPKTAVMWTGERSVVYVKSSTGLGTDFVMREVNLGPALGQSYIVESGLEEGEEIAVYGTFSIDAAAQLAGKPSMMNPEGGSPATGHQHGPEQNERPPRQPGQVTISSKASVALQPVVDQYLLIKDALVNDDFHGAKNALKQIKNELEQVNMSLFTGEAHNQYMNYSRSLEHISQEMIQADGIEQFRSHFKAFSEEMIGLVKTFKPLGRKSYVQFCPMADSDLGAKWLSLSSEIRNPFYGKQMLTCGEVEAIIE